MNLKTDRPSDPWDGLQNLLPRTLSATCRPPYLPNLALILSFSEASIDSERAFCHAARAWSALPR